MCQDGWKCWALDLQEADRGRRAWAPESPRNHTYWGLKFQPGHWPAPGLGRGTPSPPHTYTHMLLIKKLSERAVVRMKAGAQKSQGVRTGPALAQPAQLLSSIRPTFFSVPKLGNSICQLELVHILCNTNQCRIRQKNYKLCPGKVCMDVSSKCFNAPACPLRLHPPAGDPGYSIWIQTRCVLTSWGWSEDYSNDVRHLAHRKH